MGTYINTHQNVKSLQSVKKNEVSLLTQEMQTSPYWPEIDLMTRFTVKSKSWMDHCKENNIKEVVHSESYIKLWPNATKCISEPMPLNDES